MFRLFYKIFTTPKTVLPVDVLNCEQTEVSAVGAQIQEKVKKLFQGSLAIRMVDAGSTNAAEQE